MYNRYAESGRVAWTQKYARFVDPEHKEIWANLATPKGEVGMILRKITTEFKLVSRTLPAEPPGADRWPVAHQISRPHLGLP